VTGRRTGYDACDRAACSDLLGCGSGTRAGGASKPKRGKGKQPGTETPAQQAKRERAEAIPLDPENPEEAEEADLLAEV
jgi:hypothetical protein